MDEGKNLPLEIKDTVIYYMGPSPAREGRPIGSAGPTTSSRMDKYAPTLLDMGLKGMIGKGKRSAEVKNAIRDLIEQEDRRKPLSDQKICDMLAEKKIDISRRAVAKYRDEMGIPSTSGRKAY